MKKSYFSAIEKELPYSKRTILEHLKELVKDKILKTNVETAYVGEPKRPVAIKWYSLNLPDKDVEWLEDFLENSSKKPKTV